MFLSKTYKIKFDDNNKFYILADGKQSKDSRRLQAETCEALEKELRKLGVKYKLSAKAAEMKKKLG